MKSVCISNMIRRTILKRCLYDFRDVTTLNRGNILSKAAGKPSLPETSKLLLNNIGRHRRLSGNTRCNKIGSIQKAVPKVFCYSQLDGTLKKKWPRACLPPCRLVVINYLSYWNLEVLALLGIADSKELP